MEDLQCGDELRCIVNAVCVMLRYSAPTCAASTYHTSGLLHHGKLQSIETIRYLVSSQILGNLLRVFLRDGIRGLYAKGSRDVIQTLRLLAHSSA